jgi:hypothetical protein
MTWADLEPANDLRNNHREKALDRAGLFLTTFSTDTGKLVLDILKSTTIDRPVIKPDSTQFGAGIREGQNDIVRQILDQIRLAKEGFHD